MRITFPFSPIFRSAAGGMVLLASLAAGCSRQASQARHLEKAEGFFNAGRYEEAEIEYLNILHADPRNPQAAARLGEIYFDDSRVVPAYSYLSRARQLQPDNLDVRLKLGSLYLSAGKPKEGIVEIGTVLDRRPQDPEAPLLLAESATDAAAIAGVRTRLQKLPPPLPESAPVLVALGTLEIREHHFAEAEAMFKRAQAADPKSSAAWSALGALFWARNDVAQAEAAFASAASLAPARSSRRLQYAQFEIRNGKVDAGRQVLQEMTAKTPDYLPAWAMLAELAARERKFAESATLIGHVLTRDPVNLEALLLDGRLKLETGEPAQAVTKFEAALKYYPKSAPLRYQLALAHAGNGDLGQAASSLNQAISLNPDFVDAVVFQAEISVRRGDNRGAIIALKQLVQKHPEALARAWFLLAEAYRNVGDFDEAIATYHQVEKSFPGNPQTSWLMGLIYLQQRRPDEARQAFTQSLAASPDYLPAVEQLVNLDVAAKHYAEALQQIDPHLVKTPKAAALYLLQAKVYAAQSEAASAETALNKAIELQPDSATAYFMLANLYISTGQQAKALTNLQEAIAKNPKNVQALMLLAEIHSQQKDFPAARDAYEKLLAINPRFSPALNNLAYLYSGDLPNLDKAFEMAQRARDLSPSEPHAGDTLGWILFQKHQYPWALSLLEDSAGKLPDSPEVQYHLGMVHYMMGEEGPARLALQRALQLNRSFPGKELIAPRLALLDLDPAANGTDSRALLEKTVAERPDDPVALTRMAALEEHSGAIDKAIAAYQAVLKANPKNVSAALNLARLYFAHGDTDKAFELAKTVRQLAPDDPAVARLTGRLAFATGNHPWAVALLQEAAKQQPDDPELLADLGLAQYSVGQVADAETTLHSAVDRNPKFPRADEARLHLELISLAAHPVEALAAAHRIDLALQASPEDGPALMALAAADEQRLDLAAAKKTYERMLARYPNFFPAMKRLAILYSADPAQNQRTLDLATKAREKTPSDPELARVLGVAVYRQEDFPRAARLLQEAVSRSGNDAEAFYYLGLAQDRLKDRTASRQSLQHALDLNLRADLAADARRILAPTK